MAVENFATYKLQDLMGVCDMYLYCNSHNLGSEVQLVIKAFRMIARFLLVYISFYLYSLILLPNSHTDSAFNCKKQILNKHLFSKSISISGKFMKRDCFHHGYDMAYPHSFEWGPNSPGPATDILPLL